MAFSSGRHKSWDESPCRISSLECINRNKPICYERLLPGNATADYESKLGQIRIQISPHVVCHAGSVAALQSGGTGVFQYPRSLFAPAAQLRDSPQRPPLGGSATAEGHGTSSSNNSSNSRGGATGRTSPVARSASGRMSPVAVFASAEAAADRCVSETRSAESVGFSCC